MPCFLLPGSAKIVVNSHHMSKKILVIYSTVGLGHKYIALNIGAQLKELGYQVRFEDILQLQGGRLVNVSKKIYFWLINHAAPLWRLLYSDNFLINMLLPLRTKVVGNGHYQITKKAIDEYDPDLIISTELAASAVIVYLKNKGYYKKPFGVSFSDFHFQRFWFYKEVDFYLANIVEQKEKMIELGFPEDKILINGIPVSDGGTYDKNEVKAKLGITTSKTVLVTAGSLGFGINKKYVLNILEKLKKRLNDFTLLVVCGNYVELYDELMKVNDDKMKVYGFYQPMDELYAVADVFVGKPGGLSTTEALRKRLPIIVTHWMPGGEDRNIEYLTKNRLTMPVSDFRSNREEEIIEHIVSELETGAFKKQLETKSQEIEVLANTDPSRIGNFLKRVLG